MPEGKGLELKNNRGKNSAGFWRAKVSRRAFIRWTAAASAYLLFFRAMPAGGEDRTVGKDREIEVLPACVACTGCAAVCPTGAIAVVPGRITVEGRLCIRCGSCVAACPVNGIKLRSKRLGG